MNKYVKIHIFLMSLLMTSMSFGQNSYREYIENNMNYYDSILQITPDTVDIPGYKTFIRHRDFWDGRVNYSEQSPDGDKYTYINALSSFPKASKSQSLYTWNFMGPYNLSIQNYGYVESVHKDNQDPSFKTIYAGTNQSGLWKSTDNGQNWSCISDEILNYGIGVMGIDQSTSGELYIVTGGQRLEYGTGIYKSTNGGFNWTQVLAFNPNQLFNGSDIKVDPNNSNVVYCLINHSVYRTMNGGNNWEVIFELDPDNDFINAWEKKKPLVDIEINPNNSNQIVIVANSQRINNGITNDTTSSNIWRTTNALSSTPTWNKIDQNLSVFSIHGRTQFVSRYAIAQVTSQPNKLYVAFHYSLDETGVFATNTSDACTYNAGTYVYESNDFGATFNNEPVYYYNLNYNNGNLASLGFFKNEFVVSESNPSEMYLGGLYVRKFNTNDDNVYQGTGYHHADIRALDSYFNPNTHLDEIVMGNDGGVSLSTGGLNFQNIDGVGLYITQFHGIGNCKSNPDFIIGGTQDNNYFKFSNNQWTKLHSGDGYDVVVNDDNFNEHYWQNQYTLYGPGGHFNKSEGNYDSKIIQYKSDFSKLLFTDNQLYLTEDYGASWTNISNTTSNKILSAVDASKDGETIWFSRKEPTWNTTFTDKLYKSTDSGNTFTDITASLVPNGYSDNVVHWRGISDIVIHPTNPNIVWVAFENFGSSSPSSSKLRVIKTVDGGISWEDVSNNNGLPYLPVNVMKGYFENNMFHILVGNDEGIYQLKEGENTWTRINNGMSPVNVNVSDIEVNYSGRLIRIATYGRGIWEAKIPCDVVSEMLEVDSDETWDYPMWISKHILVKNGTTLTITGKIYMYAGAKILVEPHAKLIVNGGTITSSCDEMWEGITVLGDVNRPQTTHYQGKVVIYNGGTIENAKYAVSTINRIPGVGLYPTGGIVTANGAVFRNNRTDIELRPYQNINSSGHENPNLSQFKSCTFETTDEFLGIPSDPNSVSHVNLYHVNGISFKDNVFEDERTAIDVLNDGAYGIYANSAGFNVNELCSGPQSWPPPATCNGDRNEFINMKYGIKAHGLSNPSQFSIDIKNTDFNCANGVYLMDIANAEIHLNDFTVDQAFHPNPMDTKKVYGLYLDYCENYDVEGNNFIGIGTPTHTIGAAIQNEHGQNTSIYRNTFDNLTVGTEAIGQNKHTSYATGLTIQCNEYENGYANIYITEDEDNPGTINGIAVNQGVNGGATNALAGNLFGTSSTKHIYNNSMCDYFSYYYHNPASEPRVEPTLNSGSFGVFGDPTTNYSPSSCPNNLEIGIGPGLGFKSLANQQLGIVENTKADLKTLVDGGNTQELKNEVVFANEQDAYQKYNDLMSKEGYLSEEVLEEVAGKENALNKAMIRDVLVANKHAAKSEKVQAKLNQRLDKLPDYMRAQIQEGLTELSAKEYLELRQSKAKARHDFLINSGVRGLLKDSVDRTDDILEALSNTGDIAFEYRKLEILDAKGRTAEAQQVLTEMQNMEKSEKQAQDLQDFTEVRNLLNNWKQVGENMNALAEADINTLKGFVNKKNKSAAKAMVVLEANGQLDYKEPLYIPIEDNNRSAVGNWSSFGAPTLEKDMLKLYPNPAKDYFTVEYSFTSNDKPIVIKVSDVQGKVLYSKELQYKHDQLVIDASNYKKGIYYMSLFAGGKLIKSKSIQIDK